MRSVFSALMADIISYFRSHQSLRLENMALRYQVVYLRPADKYHRLTRRLS